MQRVFIEQFGTHVNFPDEFSRDEIADAIKTNVIPELTRRDEERRKAEAQRRKDETGLLEAFGTGLSRGIGQTSALLGDALPAIAADLVGADEYRDRQLQEYQESMERIERESPSAVPTFRDIDDAGDAGLYAAETVGQFIPSIATSLLGGGIGGFIGKKTAERFAKKMVGDAAKKAVEKGTQRGLIAGTFAGSGSQTIPEAYTSISEATVSRKQPPVSSSGYQRGAGQCPAQCKWQQNTQPQTKGRPVYSFVRPYDGVWRQECWS